MNDDITQYWWVIALVAILITAIALVPDLIKKWKGTATPPTTPNPTLKVSKVLPAASLVLMMCLITPLVLLLFIIDIGALASLLLFISGIVAIAAMTDWGGVPAGSLDLGYLFGTAIAKFEPGLPVFWPLFKRRRTPTTLQTMNLFGHKADGSDAEGMEVFVKKDDTDSTSKVSFKVKATVFWEITDHPTAQSVIMKSLDENGEWDKNKKALEGNFVGDAISHIRTSLAKVSHNNILADETLRSLNDLSALNNLDGLNRNGIRITRITVTKARPTDPNFEKLLAGETEEDLQLKKEDKDITALAQMVKKAMTDVYGYPPETNLADLPTDRAAEIMQHVQTSRGNTTTDGTALAALFGRLLNAMKK